MDIADGANLDTGSPITPTSSMGVEAKPERVQSSNSLSLLGESLVMTGSSPGVEAQLASDSSNRSEAAQAILSLNNEASVGSKQSRRRPPRPPVTPAAPQDALRKQQGKAGHKNVQSTGDYSFVSALTEGSAEEQGFLDPPNLKRDRAVSFDMNSLLQPVLSDVDELPETILAPSPARRPSEGLGQNALLERRLTMTDITSPLEAEAETAILLVLENEEKDRESHPEECILPHISDDDAQVFTKDATRDVQFLERTNNLSDYETDHENARASSPASVSANQLTDSRLEVKLVGLTKAIAKFRRKEGRAKRVEPEEQVRKEKIETCDPMVQGTADAFLQNGHALFRRTKGSLRLNKYGDLSHRLRDSDWKDTDGSAIVSDEAISDKKNDLEALELGEVRNGHNQAKSGGRSKKTKIGRLFRRTKRIAEDEFVDIADFLQPRNQSLWLYLRVLCLLLFSLLGIAAILFYGADNPDAAKNGPSISWCFIFAARLSVTFTLAKVTEIVVIEYLTLRVRWTVRLFGTAFSLGLVQSKGFPFILVVWPIHNFILLSGSHRFAKNWLFWQDAVAMFNNENPSGDILVSSQYRAALGLGIFVGVAVTLKRFWWGFLVGKKTYLNFGDQLAKVMENILLLSEVSELSILVTRRESTELKHPPSMGPFSLQDYITNNVSSQNTQPHGRTASSANEGLFSRPEAASKLHLPDRIIDEDMKDNLTGTLTVNQKARIQQLLGDWEEPELVSHMKGKVSITAILEFRQALTFMDSDFPFSISFGRADRRESCIESAQVLYDRLKSATPREDQLPFETIALAGIDKDGAIDQKKMKNLVRFFRPDRQGNLSMLDFVKSCDHLYKSMRLLRVSIRNAGQIDNAFEGLVNWICYAVLAVIVIAVLGYDPLALIVSLSSIVLAFAFMIGSASSKYFEGILFVLVRRPYDIGDRIAISGVDQEANPGGSSTWFVQNVDLFTTTVRYATTNEVATLANGSLASTRIINAQRSPKALRYIYMKFGVNVPYQKVQVFKMAVETFVKDRPREWIAFSSFRATRVEHDQGFIEYVIVLQHRESWQNLGPILQSSADVASFCLELAKKLEMRYVAPPLPVDLSMHTAPGGRSNTHEASVNSSAPSPDLRDIAHLFEKGDAISK